MLSPIRAPPFGTSKKQTETNRRRHRQQLPFDGPRSQARPSDYYVRNQSRTNSSQIRKDRFSEIILFSIRIRRNLGDGSPRDEVRSRSEASTWNSEKTSSMEIPSPGKIRKLRRQRSYYFGGFFSERERAALRPLARPTRAQSRRSLSPRFLYFLVSFFFSLIKCHRNS